MRIFIYFLIFLYFATVYDSFWIGLLAAFGARFVWNYLSARSQQATSQSARTGRGGAWREASWGRGRGTQGASHYDFAKGHIVSHLFPNERFNPVSFYVATLFLCLGRIAKAKGVVKEEDIALANGVMDRLRLTEPLRAEARKRFNQGKDANFSVAELVKEVKRQFIAFPSFQRTFFDICLGAAILNGQIVYSEKEILRDLFPLTGGNPLFFDEFISQFEQGSGYRSQQRSSRGSSYSRGGYQGYQQTGWQQAAKSELAEALATLGVSEDVTQDELKRVYRKLINQHHPDKLAGQNVPEGLVEMAKQKTQEIIKAYNYINEYKGWR